MTGIGVEIPCSCDGHRHPDLGIATDITHLRDVEGCQGVGPWKEVSVGGHLEQPVAHLRSPFQTWMRTLIRLDLHPLDNCPDSALICGRDAAATGTSSVTKASLSRRCQGDARIEA